MKRVLFCILLIMLCIGMANAVTIRVNATTDGYAKQSADSSYTIMRNAAGDGATANPAVQVYGFEMTSIAASPYWSQIWRGIIVFNASAYGLPSNAIIDSAILSIYINDKVQTIDSNDNITVTGGVLNDITTIANGDYDGFNQTEYTNRLTFSSITNPSRTNFTFNAAGIANISKTGPTVLFFRDFYDVANITPPQNGLLENRFGFTSKTGTSANREYLEITYHTTTSPVSSFTCTKNFLRIPNSVTCTDSSTNTPTSWSWNMGDGSAAKTTQNVTYAFTKRGKWGITLNATNAQGSNVTPAATNVRIVGYENNY
jgi:hypothetical protein